MHMPKIQHTPSSLFNMASRAICNQDCGHDKVLGGEEGGKTFGKFGMCGKRCTCRKFNIKDSDGARMAARWHTIFASDFMACKHTRKWEIKIFDLFEAPLSQKFWTGNRQMSQMLKVFQISIWFDLFHRTMLHDTASQFMTCKLAGFTWLCF